MKKRLFIFVLTLMCFFAMPALLHAQTDDDTPPGGDETDVPFDGGASLIMLVTSGVVYGLREAHKRKNNEEADL